MTTQLRAKTDKQFDEEQADRRAFMAALRAAGWTRIAGDAAVYQHDDGGKLNADEYRPEWGMPMWKWYMGNGKMPETQ